MLDGLNRKGSIGTHKTERMRKTWYLSFWLKEEGLKDTKFKAGVHQCLPFALHCLEEGNIINFKMAALILIDQLYCT